MRRPFKIPGYSPILHSLSMPEKLLYRNDILKKSKLHLPDFLGIGAPQSGTTWLYENLGRHPEIFLSEKKELHYFDRMFHLPLSWYSGKFAQGENRLKGEVTPAYSILNKKRIKFISQLIPDVKLIYLIRHPVNQRLSGLRRVVGQYREKHGEDPSDNWVRDILAKTSIRPGYYQPGVHKSHFATSIENWTQFFSQDQLFVGLFDQLLLEPDLLIRDIFSFLGKPLPTNWDSSTSSKKVNSNPPIEIKEEFREIIKDMVRHDLTRLKPLMKGKVDHWEL